MHRPSRRRLDRARRRARDPPGQPRCSPILLAAARVTSLLLGAGFLVDLPQDFLDPLTGDDAGIDLERELRYLADAKLAPDNAAQMRTRVLERGGDVVGERVRRTGRRRAERRVID